MPTQLTRRGILKALGIGAAAAIIEEPIRKLWFVPSTAPVGSRIEYLEGYGDDLEVPSPGGHIDRMVARQWALKLELADEDLYDSCYDGIIDAARRVQRTMYAEQRRELASLPARILKPLSAAEQAALSGGTWRIESIERAENMAKSFVTVVTGVPSALNVKVSWSNDLKFTRG